MSKPTLPLLQGTRADLVRSLRLGPRTVNDLAAALGITDNAVRAQLARLGADGLVAAAGQRPAARRPEQLYALTPEAESLFPKAYDVLLGQLLDALEKHMGGPHLSALLDGLGRSMGARLGDPGRDESLRQRADRVVRIVEGLGGAAVIEEEEDRLCIQGRSCPVAAVAKGRPAVCHMVGELLSAGTGQPVHVECINSPDHVRCAFTLDREG